MFAGRLKRHQINHIDGANRTSGPLECQGDEFFPASRTIRSSRCELLPFVDMIAEHHRIRWIGDGTARMTAAHSTLNEYRLETVYGQAHLKVLVESNATFAALIRKAMIAADEHHDKATEDLFTEVSLKADKRLWFVEAHTQHGPWGLMRFCQARQRIDDRIFSAPERRLWSVALD